jgi:hypothetical protein
VLVTRKSVLTADATLVASLSAVMHNGGRSQL